MPAPNTVVTALATACVCLVGVTVAGPLDPPAGPVAQTDPDLSQIFAAVQAGTSGDCCGSRSSEPGDMRSATVRIDNLPPFQALEWEFVTENSFSTSAPGMSEAEYREMRITRLVDNSTNDLFEKVLENGSPFVSGSIVANGAVNPFTLNFSTGAIIEQRFLMANTCDGSRLAERITLVFAAAQLVDSDGAVAWNTATNSGMFPGP